VLYEAGYVPVPFASAEATLAYLRAGGRPAAMIVDHLLPGMQGLALVDACEEDRELAGIPTLIISGLRLDDLAPGSIARGRQFFQKPFAVTDLMRVLTALIRPSATDSAAPIA
jgi:two-component system, OmpR family, response regulator